ncbi:MAG: hypothetical protein ACFFB0_02690 [Promethearchaeota archaeon]
MCYYITATLPNDVNLEELKSYFDKFNMDFSPINNSNVKPQLRPNEMYLRATKSYCDCDTVLGSQNLSQEYKKLLKSKKIRTLKKKKWSEEQIHNWIMNKINSKQHKTALKKTPIEIHQEIDKWRNFLHTILNVAKIKRIGLIKHWYNTGLVNEEILIKNTEEIKFKEITPNLLLNLEEDVLYEFFATHSF